MRVGPTSLVAVDNAGDALAAVDGVDGDSARARPATKAPSLSVCRAATVSAASSTRPPLVARPGPAAYPPEVPVKQLMDSGDSYTSEKRHETLAIVTSMMSSADKPKFWPWMRTMV